MTSFIVLYAILMLWSTIVVAVYEALQVYCGWVPSYRQATIFGAAGLAGLLLAWVTT